MHNPMKILQLFSITLILIFSGFTMKNVEDWNPDKSMFEIPQNYQMMDMPSM
jgi:hypothetical protein